MRKEFRYIPSNKVAMLLRAEDNHVRCFAQWAEQPGESYHGPRSLSKSQKRGWVFVGSVWAFLAVFAILA